MPEVGAGSEGREDGRVHLGEASNRAEIDFLECTDANHLRHTKFVRLRDDKDPRKVVRQGVIR